MIRSAEAARRVAAGGGLAFVVAGLLTICASWIRWADTCGPGLQTEACAIAQDHRFDYLPPSDPWEPSGISSTVAGAAYVLVAIGLVLLFRTARSALWARLIQAVLVGSVLGIGLNTLLSAWGGAPVGGDWVGIPWMLSPLLLATVALEIAVQDAAAVVMSDRAWCGWAGALVLANPFMVFVLTSIVVGSSATSPWDGIVGGVGFLLAGLMVLVGVSRAAARSRVTAGSSA